MSEEEVTAWIKTQKLFGNENPDICALCGLNRRFLGYYIDQERKKILEKVFNEIKQLPDKDETLESDLHDLGLSYMRAKALRIIDNNIKFYEKNQRTKQSKKNSEKARG